MRHPIKTTDLKLVGFKPCVDIFANTRQQTSTVTKHAVDRANMNLWNIIKQRDDDRTDADDSGERIPGEHGINAVLRHVYHQRIRQ